MKSKDINFFIKEQNEVIVNRLEHQAQKQPNKKYLYYGEENLSFTYKEFNNKTNAIANNLQSLGVQKEDIISVFLYNPMIATFSMFSIWKTGAIYCPINFNYKGKLLSYQLTDTKTKVLITENKLLPLINEIIDETDVETVIVYNPDRLDNKLEYSLSQEKDNRYKEIDFTKIMQGNMAKLNVDLHYSDLANIVYTSGTTGLPKGVLQSHRWMNNYTFYRRRFFNEDDIIYNDLPLYHVGGAFFNIVSATWAGAGIALWDKFSGKNFWKRINISGATSVLLLDVMIPWLMDADEKDTDRENTVYKVYMQPLPKHHHKVAKRFGFDIVMSGFGQTEAGQGIVGVINELKEGEGTPIELLKGKTPNEIVEECRRLDVSIVNAEDNIEKGYMGNPSMLVEAAILNENDEECSIGEVGQLAFRPKYPNIILQEYYNKPEATVEAYRNLWFHTGDACYKTADDVYYFVDRMGGIIRVKGEFVSSYQVEDYINNHPGVTVCAAFPIPAQVGNEDDIVVFVVRKEGISLTEKELVQWIEKELPKYMWPKYIRFTDDLPRTPSSKIEKFKLKKSLEDELYKI